MPRIPVSGPSITELEVEYVADAVRRCWYGQANEYHERFERVFTRYVGVRHAVALPSCTSALHLALAALGIGPGDEVIVPDATWIATSAPISYVGATPVFADIDPDTWCLCAKSCRSLVTERTKAIIAVDLYGGLPDWHELRELAFERGLALIEDAAEAIGSEFQGRRAGSLGDVGTFSFHGSKTLTTGEGGMLVTDRDDLHQRVLSLRDHGRPPGDRMFWNAEVAYKYKMSSMQAALGLAQMERLEALVERKREIFAAYRVALGEVPHVTLNWEPPGTKNTYWMVTVVVDPALGLTKEALIAELGRQDIDCRPFFHPLSSLPAYAACPQAAAARARNVHSYRISPYGINLPSGLNLTERDIRRVSLALTGVIESATTDRQQAA